MIFESYPWKQEIDRHRKLIATWSKKADTARGYFMIERGVFVSAFAVRKLIENNKITDRVRNRPIEYLSHKPFRPLSDRVSRVPGVFDISKDYDLSNPEKGCLSLYDVCSEIIHSYVFVPEIDDDDVICSFHVNSNRHKDRRLLKINAVHYCDMLKSISEDSVVSARYRVDETGKMHIELD